MKSLTLLIVTLTTETNQQVETEVFNCIMENFLPKKKKK